MINKCFTEVTKVSVCRNRTMLEVKVFDTGLLSISSRVLCVSYPSWSYYIYLFEPSLAYHQESSKRLCNNYVERVGGGVNR